MQINEQIIFLKNRIQQLEIEKKELREAYKNLSESYEKLSRWNDSQIHSNQNTHADDDLK